MKFPNRFVAGVAIIVLILSVHAVAAEPCPATAQEFWRHFRQALISGNVDAVTNHVNFRFSLCGTLDSSQRKMLNIDEFKAAFPKLMSTDPGLSPEPSTMKALASTTRRLGVKN